jgi:glycosyltransferase involved in cell wall biosynthesis
MPKIYPESLISIIIPCYNYAHYLEDSINNLQKQTYQNWEAIIVDDGSTDNTKEVASNYVLKDKRIKYVYQLNAGLSAARITGLKEAAGFFIQFLDADDLLGVEKFEREMKIFQENPNIGIVYSDYLLTDVKLDKYWKDVRSFNVLLNNSFLEFVKYWENGLMIPIHCFLYRKTYFEVYGSFDTNLRMKEDWDLHLKFSFHKISFLYHDYVGAIYRIHNKSLARNNYSQNKNYILRVLSKYYSIKEMKFKNKIVILNRYLNVVVDCFISKIRYNRVNFLQVIKVNNFKLNVLIAVLFPIKFLFEMIKIFKNKLMRLFR